MPVQAFLRAGLPIVCWGGILRWLTASGLELPAQIVNDVARRFAPGLIPEEMLRPHGGASGGGRRGLAAVQEEDAEAGKGWKRRMRTKTTTCQ